MLSLIQHSNQFRKIFLYNIYSFFIIKAPSPSKDIYNFAIYNNAGVGEIFIDEIQLSGKVSVFKIPFRE